ncbi:MAG: hypothetical protein JW878_08325, partial [Methanomicrobia archaeon]|nr:hypothetical protein [Methanomicrobia archaeon]
MNEKIITVAIAFISAFVLLTTVASVTTLDCDCGNLSVNETGGWHDGGDLNLSCTPISHAVDNATAGETICVHSGTYYENVNVNKQLILLSVGTGGGKPVVDADGIGSAIRRSHDDLVLAGFAAINASNISMADDVVDELPFTPVADGEPPEAPIISSPTHPDENLSYCNSSPVFSWTTPVNQSGIACYSYVLDNSASTTPDETCDTSENTSSYTNLTFDTWYFHVRAKDDAENWGPAAHFRVQIANCDTHDGCYVYDDGCEDRDYYCSEGTCTYNYSNRHTDYYDGYVYYCSGDTVRKHQIFHDFYCDGGVCTEHTSWAEDQLVENCSDYDGWYCNGDLREYRDYYCSGGNCTYTVVSSDNCSDNDGCYVYGDGCEVRDYYCFEGSCTY